MAKGTDSTMITQPGVMVTQTTTRLTHSGLRSPQKQGDSERDDRQLVDSHESQFRRRENKGRHCG